MLDAQPKFGKPKISDRAVGRINYGHVCERFRQSGRHEVNAAIGLRDRRRARIHERHAPPQRVRARAPRLGGCELGQFQRRRCRGGQKPVADPDDVEASRGRSMLEESSRGRHADRIGRWHQFGSVQHDAVVHSRKMEVPRHGEMDWGRDTSVDTGGLDPRHVAQARVVRHCETRCLSHHGWGDFRLRQHVDAPVHLAESRTLKHSTSDAGREGVLRRERSAPKFRGNLLHATT